MPSKQAHLRYKFLLLPGSLVTTSDVDPHYISSGDLMKCYGVHSNECQPHMVPMMPKSAKKMFPNLIHLKPRVHGDYAEWLIMMVKYWREKL